MRIKYKKIILTCVTVQIVLMWFYILHRPEKNLNGLGIFDRDIHLQYSTPLIDDNRLIRHETENRHEASKQVAKGNCIGLVLPAHLVQNDSWSAVAGTVEAFVFSAYTFRLGDRITVVGASTRPSTKLFCQYWEVSQDNSNIQFEEKEAHVRFLPEHHSNKYSGALFECPSTSFAVTYVSLVTKQCSVPLSLFTIHNASKPQQYQRKFTVCVKPLHFKYGRAYELVEWIELNRIIGADKFIIYNYSSAENVAEVLKHYVKQNIVELVQWNLPIRSYTWPRIKGSVEIHSIGMLPMLQDCLFRSKQHSEFVVNIDVDEFIVPRSKNVTNWSEMLHQFNTYADTYVFRNTFFRKEWNSSKIEFPERKLVDKLRLITLQKFEHEAVILPAGQRSKYFTRTAHENILMIHGVVGGSSKTVPIEIGLLNHYRDWQNYNDTSKRVVDDTVLQKYGRRLIDQVQRVWRELVNVKMDIPI